MNNNLSDKILSVCRSLHVNNVEYLIVGGTAVAYYGYFRWSQNPDGSPAEKFDLDIWYNPTYKNYFNLLAAISDLGQDVSEFLAEADPEPLKSYFRLDLEKFTLDFLPRLKGSMNFRKAFSKCELARVRDIDIAIISFDDLLADKGKSSRPSDLDDIRHLKLKRNS